MIAPFLSSKHWGVENLSPCLGVDQSSQMWGNITGVMGKALEKVQMIQSELESQMDAAVGAQQMDASKPGIQSAPAPSVAPQPQLSENFSASAPEEDRTGMATVDLSDSKPAAAAPGAETTTAASRGKKATRQIKKGKGSTGDSTPTDGVTTPTAATVPSEPSNTTVDQAAELQALKTKYESQIESMKQNHKDELATLQEKIANLEGMSKRYNQQKFDEAQRQWQTESSSRAEAAARAAAAEKSALQEELQVSNSTWSAKVAAIEREHESHVATLQAQLKAADSGDQAAAVTEEFTRRIETLHASLTQAEAETAQERGKLKDSQVEFQAQVLDLQSQLQAQSRQLADLAAEKEALLRQLAESATNANKEDNGEELTQANATIAALQQDLQSARTQLASKDADLAGLLADLGKVKEALAERERALETATKNLSEQHRLSEGYVQKIADLTSEIAEKDARHRQAQGTVAEDEENRRLVVRLQEQLREQGERLAAFEKEGQSLAKKQSDMEKVVRNTKKELRDKETEIQKLKESKEQLVKALEQTQDVLKKHEGDANNASKSLSAMQAVSQASTEKLVRLEAELTAKTEEYASQRRALEAAWNEATELKRVISELKADRDDLRKRIGEGTSKVMETESSRRDIEQREAVLRATSKQLQDSLQRQMAESAAREERLREEVNEMRKRWQEAVASRESMASELGNATAPLLRQISSLQESVRVKSEHWQNVESSLSERALRAENNAEIAEHKRALMEEQLQELKQQYATCHAKLIECQTQLTSAEVLVERLKKRESLWSEEKMELDSKLAMEIAQRQSLQATLREIELRHKVEVQELQDAAAATRSQGELELAMAHKDLEVLREELAAAKANGGFGASTPMRKHQSSSKLSLQNLHKAGQNGSHDRLLGPEGSTVTSDSGDAGSAYVNGAEHLASSSLPSGEATFAAAEKLQQRSRQRDDDLQSLALQIQRLEASRNALLEEVSYLSMRNAQLEEQCASVPGLRAEVEACTKRTEMLLVLLGEKEEELEGALADMKEVRTMYRAHMDELLDKCNPPLTADSPVPPHASSTATAAATTTASRTT